MESLKKYIDPYETVNEDEFLQKLANCLTDGGDINFIFLLNKSERIHGTLLHHSIMRGYKKIVEYALSKGANIEIEMTSKPYRNALELAIYEYNYILNSNPWKKRIYEMLKKRSLELYSPYGLTPFHVNCAVELSLWSDEALRSLRTASVNMAVSTDSPIWPGMAPILIAAKFHNENCAKCLIELGADPLTRDLEGNTPLHYLYEDINPKINERLFARDGSDTFGSYSGLSHFHIACVRCPGTLSIVKRYLEQNTSPDLQIKQSVGEKLWGETGLHLAAYKECPELMRLLLEYGADIDMVDSNGDVPMDHISDFRNEIINASGAIDCVCLSIEAGSKQEKIDTSWILNDLLYSPYFFYNSKVSKEFLSCIKRLTMLSEKLVSKKLKDLYSDILKEFNDYRESRREFWNADGEEPPDDPHDWNELEYTCLCSKELKALSGLGLRHLLDDTVIVRSDFNNKFGCLDSFDFESYPIYGNLLKMKFKRKLLELEKKRKKIRLAIPKVQWLFQEHGHFPHLCADLILRNLSSKELDQFIAQ